MPLCECGAYWRRDDLGNYHVNGKPAKETRDQEMSDALGGDYVTMACCEIKAIFIGYSDNSYMSIIDSWMDVTWTDPENFFKR